MHVVALVLREGTVLTVMGTLAGVVASLAFAGVMSRLVFGVSSRDPLTFVAVPALIIVAAVVANFLPARRAVREDAFLALRAE